MTSPTMLRNHEPYIDTTQKREDASTSSSYHGYTHYPNTYSYQTHCHDSLVYVVPSDSPNEDLVTKNAGSRWREDETEALVEIWRDKICQTRWWKQSKGVRVNKEMWEEIAQLLAERDVFRTPSQCQIRMKNLLQFYRQTIDSRRSEKSWGDLPEYFDIVDRIMTRKEGNVNGGEKVTGEISVVSHGEDINNNEHNLERESKHSISEAKKENSEGADLAPSEQCALKFEDETHINGEERKRYPVFGVSSINGDSCSNPTRYTNFHHGYAQPGPSSMYQNYFPRKSLSQKRWVGQNACCDGPSPKIQCTGNEKDFISHHPEITIDRNYATTHQGFVRPSSQFMEVRQNSGNHPCSSAGNCQLQTCTHHKAGAFLQVPHSFKSIPSFQETDYQGCGGNNSFPFIQELLHLQYKQMGSFLEIEKKRLEIEERRLQEEKEASNRNTAFIMEAVKILAETFRSGDSKTEKNEH